MYKFSLLKRKYLLKPLIISLFFVVFYAAVSSKVRCFDIAALKAKDLFSQLKYRIKPVPKEVKDIVIVSIDNRAYDWFNKKWPWPRIVHANLIYKLTEYKPRIMALNLAFIGESQRKGEDDLLAQAFKDAGNVYVATYYDKEGRHHPPYEKFAAVVKGFGSSNKPQDKDSVIRYTKLFTASISNIILNYSFEFKIACDFLGIPLEKIDFDGSRLFIPEAGGRERTIRLKNDGMTILNFETLLKNFTVIPILDLLQDKVSEGVFKDKIVLVDMTGESLGAIYSTPIGKMPGAGIIANNIIMLLRHSFVEEIPGLINIFALVLFAVSMGILAYKTNLLNGFKFLLLLIIVFFFLSLAIAMLNLVWDFFGIPFVILCVFLTINFQKFIYSAKELLIVKKKVVKDTLTGLPSPQYLLCRLERNLGEAIKEGTNLSLVLFSINNYALLKSSLEIALLEKLLRQLAGLVQRYSRKTRYLDFISRYSEDKFCTLLQITEFSGAQAYAKRIQKAVEKHKFLGKNGLNISLGIGIATYPIVKPKDAADFIETALHKIGTDTYFS